MSKTKIVKAGGAEPDEFEASVAQEFLNLEVWMLNWNQIDSFFRFFCLLYAIQIAATEMKGDLQHLHLTAAKELELDGGRKAIILFVPFRQLKDYHKVHPRLVRELEKKFRYVRVSKSTIVMTLINFALKSNQRPTRCNCSSTHDITQVRQQIRQAEGS